MRRRTTVLRIVLAVTLAALAGFALAISHDSACVPPPPVTGSATSMKAIRHHCYGGPDVLTLDDVARPTPADNEVLVEVRAASVNPLDWHFMRGKPYVMRLSSGFGAPDDPRMGVDFAGTVAAVGRNVRRFKPGEEVFGGRNGALAQYLTVREDRGIVHKPANVTFEEAAAVPVAAITALQAVRDKGQVTAGRRVLINGASGGVGTFAVQIAKSLGAHVTGVCSTRNVELVRSLGADHVVDYTRENFTEGAQRYDVIIDNVGNHPLRAYRRVLPSDGIVVIVGGPSDDPWLGPMTLALKAAALSPLVGQRFEMFMSNLNQPDLTTLRDLMAAGTLRSVIDRRYPLAESAAAIAYLEQGHARGKVIVTVE